MLAFFKKTNLWAIIGIASIFLGSYNTLAQTIELEILGGGYKLRGPETINFPDQFAGFTEINSYINFSELQINPSNELENPTKTGGIIIIDENGGSPFSVTVSATQLTYDIPGPGPIYTIPKNNFRIKNTDDNQNEFELINGSAEDFSLATMPNQDSEGFSAFSTDNINDITLTLATGSGKAPGRFKIFPKLKIIIPSGQHPGNYTSTLVFTIA